jgi:hypothetical protein
MKYNWVATQGNFKVGRETIKFASVGKSQTSGQIMNDQYFSEGHIIMEVEFAEVDENTSCEIIFYWDPNTSETLSAGIIPGEDFFGIRKQNQGRTIEIIKTGGSRAGLKFKKTYSLELSLKGTEVRLSIDGVEVIVDNFPATLKQSQTGFLCRGNSELTVSKYLVRAKRPKVFMVMQFSEKYTQVYEEVIKEVCIRDFNLEVIKGDEIYGPGLILADVNDYIKEAKVVIADITPVNANVYYEVGYAHAINKPTILIAEKGTTLPFDVSPFRVLFYENTISGKKRIEEGLKKHLGSILNQ